MKSKFLNNYTFGLGLALVVAVSVFMWLGQGKQDAAAIVKGPAGQSVALEQVREFKDWRLVCTAPVKGGKKQCQIVQSVRGEGKKSAALTAIIQAGQIKDKPVAVMVFMLPLGTLLPPGVTLKVDAEKEIKIPYQQCRKGGCMVRVAVDKTRLDKIKAGKSMQVGYKVMDGKGVVAPLSLNGFSQAVDALWQASAKG